jgi:hypothetical protein
MKSVGRVHCIRRTGDEQGGKRLDRRRRRVMRFGLNANRRGDERRKTVAFDADIRHPGFIPLIDPDRRFIAVIAGTASTAAAVFLITSAAIAILIGPLFLIRLFRVGLVFAVPVIPVLKRALRTRATLRPGETLSVAPLSVAALSVAQLSVAIVLEGPVNTWLRGTGLWLRHKAWLRRRTKTLGDGSKPVGDTAEIAVVLGLFR